jgi:hypothetical protein
MYGPPQDCKEKVRDDKEKSASMYPAFRWR